MVEFLIRSGCSHHIDEIVRRAKEKVWLISPFIKVADHIKELLNDKDGAGVDMRLVHGKSELREGEREWLESLKSLRIYYRENLHAKCYMNEDYALITSMNLYEFSQINNDEWGILVSRENDGEIYQEIEKAANEIFDGQRTQLVFGTKEAARDSQPATTRTASAPPAQTKTAKRPRKRTADRKPSLPKTGVCVRDGAAIEFNILNPYCYTCFGVWNNFKNREYKEEKCHACGRDWTTDMDRPLCLGCLLRYRGLLVEQGHGREHPGNGVCIRDGQPIEFDLSKPYCGKCFRSWNRYKNREYEEKICHMCGREGEGLATMERPICLACYLNVAHIAFTQTLGSDYVPWLSVDDDLAWQ